MSSSILTYEELILLRKKYLPAIHKAYAAMVLDLNRLADRAGQGDAGDIWLSDTQQRQVLRKMLDDFKNFVVATNAFRVYVHEIFDRLNEPT